MAAGEIVVRTIVSGSTLDGNTVREFDEQKTYTWITDVFEHTMTVPTTLVTALSIGAVAGGGLATLTHLIVHNQDDANYVTLGLLAANGAAYFKIGPGQIFHLTQDDLEAFAAATAFSAFETLATINLQAITGACVCRVVAL